MVPWPGYILIWLLTKVDLNSKVQWMVIKSNMKIVLEFSCFFFPFSVCNEYQSLLEQVKWCQFVTPARIRLSSNSQKFLSMGFSNWQLIASIWKFFFLETKILCSLLVLYGCWIHFEFFFSKLIDEIMC